MTTEELVAIIGAGKTGHLDILHSTSAVPTSDLQTALSEDTLRARAIGDARFAGVDGSREKSGRAIMDAYVMGTGVSIAGPYFSGNAGPVVFSDPRPDATEAATAAERARILAKLQELRPTETQYTRREWRWEEKGAQAMFDKILRAIEGAQ